MKYIKTPQIKSKLLYTDTLILQSARDIKIDNIIDPAFIITCELEYEKTISQLSGRTTPISTSGESDEYALSAILNDSSLTYMTFTPN